MFLHLGNDVLVNTNEILGIFDIENTSIGKNTREFLKNATEQNEIVTVSYEMPKSFVVCINKANEQKVYISQISCSTLKKRFNSLTYSNI